jgi:ABC-2 type transport system ATP-binding protein
MSCGQRSQVALGLILAQNPDLLVLDDFTLGLDPGYRRLFIDFLREYSKEQGMTVFTTSHIIQDMERLIDDCMIMDYNRVLVYEPVKEFMSRYRQYRFQTESNNLELKKNEMIIGYEQIGNSVELYSYCNPESVQDYLRFLNIRFSDFQEESATLEDAFIGLTGKY